jgi:hypothetical protein
VHGHDSPGDVDAWRWRRDHQAVICSCLGLVFALLDSPPLTLRALQAIRKPWAWSLLRERMDTLRTRPLERESSWCGRAEGPSVPTATFDAFVRDGLGSTSPPPLADVRARGLGAWRQAAHTLRTGRQAAGSEEATTR